MSFGSSSTSSSDSKVLTLQVSQSSAGLAMPLVWGTNKLPANLLWYSDFVATPHTQSQGGKGGGGGQTSTSYTYSSAFVLGLCAGQIAGVRKVWKDKTTTTPAALGFEVHTGALGQPVWSYLSSKHADEAIGYSGVAYLAASAFDLGSDTSPPSLSFEIQGRSIISGADDAEPADVITDIATDALIGVGVQSAQIADLTDYRTWCKAMGFRLSPAVDSQTAASSVVTDILTASYADSVWSEGKLKIIPYGDAAVTGNGVTWTPNVTPVYDLTEDHFLDTEQPIKITRSRVSDAYNSQKIEYLDRANDYNTAVAETSDLAAIDRFGPRPADVKTLHCICQLSIAETVAAAWNARETNIRNTYEFKVDCRFGRLEPMDIVTLTHARLGMNRLPVRIVDTDTDEDNDITITAEEWPFGVAAPARISSQSGSGYIPDMNVSAGNANSPVIFEPPVSLAGEPEIWIGTAGGANWGGAEVWVSLDGNTYSAAGKITAPARHGLTTAAFAAGGDPDNTNTLSVDLSASAGALLPGTAAERDMFQTLVYVGGELVAYQGATLTGSNRYDLANLRRGAYGTPVTAHSTGAAVLRCDDAVFRYPYDPALVGKTIYIKLRSYNKTGAGYQDLAAVQATAYTVVGAPLGAVAGLVLARPFTGKTLSVTWSAYSGASSYTVELWSGGAKCKTVKGLASTAFEIDIAGLKAAGCGRSVEVRVYAVAANGQSSTAAVLVASKAQIAAPTVAAADSGGAVQVTCTKPSDESYSGTRFWVQSASGFNPASTAASYDGPNTMFDTGRLSTGGTYYVRAACYDAFGADALNYTSEVAVTIVQAVDGVATVADASKIAAAVGSNPPGGKAYWAVYDAATKQMGRWDSAQGKYVFAVKASDIAGAIQQAQLDATLSSRINLIDAPATTAGSVAAQVLAETNTRVAAITAEAQARAAAIQQEASDRAASVAAEAAARGTAVTNEQTARQQGDTQLAQQITTITAAGAGAFDAAAQWGFDSDVQGWAGGGIYGVLSYPDPGWARIASGSSGSAEMDSPAISVSGALYKLVRARVKRVAGSGWYGSVWFATSSHDRRSNRHVTCPIPNIGDTAVIEWDMSGVDDWDSSTVTGFRLSLGSSAADVFDIDWIAVGRNAPGASVAGLQAEQTARQSGDSANAQSITTLTARLNSGGDIATSIATAQSTASAAVSTGNANSSAIAALQSSVGTTNANLTTESSTRASADSALGTRIDSLSTTVNGNTSAITSEQTARANADSANASAISAVQASLQGGGNLLANPGMDSGIAGWNIDWKQYDGDAWPTIMQNGVDAPWLPPSGYVLNIHRASPYAGVQDVRNAKTVAVSPGQHLCASAYFSVHRGCADIFIMFVDKDGAWLADSHSATTQNADVPAQYAAGYGRQYVFAVAPANAAAAYFKVRFYGSQSYASTNDPYCFLYRPQLEFATPSQTQPSPWSDSAVNMRSDMAAAVNSEQSARIEADNAMSVRVDTVVSDYKAADASTLTTAKAYTESWSYAKSAVDSAIASASQTLTTAFQSADASTLSSAQSYVQGYSYSKSAADSAIASSVSTVSARLNDGGDIKQSVVSVTSTANAASSTASGTAAALSGTWQVQVDAGGKVAGLKAYSTGATSGFVISADKVLIGDLTNLCGSGMGDTADGWVAGGPITNDWGTSQSNNWWLSHSPVKSRYALLFHSRDSLYGNFFSVKAGDQFAVSMDTVTNGVGVSPYNFSLGLLLRAVDGSEAFVGGAVRPAGQWDYYPASGVVTIPAGYAQAMICVQIDGPGGTDFQLQPGQSHFATNIIVRRMNGSELIVDGGITANKLSADAVNAVSVTAQNAVFTKIAAASLSALAGTLGTLNVSGWLYINGDGGSSWGGIRTSGKTWDGDGVDGFVVYRNSGDGSLHLEAKAGNNRISMTPGYADINFSNNFAVDNSGTVTMQSASSGARRVMTNSADRYYDASGVLRIEITV